MILGIEGKKALVTGASRGIGRAIALSLAQEGAQVAVVSRSQGQLEALVEEMGGKQAGHIAITLDLVEEGAPKKLSDELGACFGHPDIVVHNLGGTLDINDPFCSIEDWRRVWRFNLEVSIELNLLLLPHMQEGSWGRIVHISSIAALENHGPVPYCSIKAALTAYTRSMGRFLAPKGIVMSAVLPGAVLTEGGYWDNASRERPEHVEKYLKDRMAIQRFGELEEVSSVVTFLCSKQASFCIGSVFPVDGGQGRGYFG
ncbi:MAG TPA: NAD(P)-dependent oxidoreductase [Cyanobacteria bacterium UBA8530]|nr:NAD(P)-dependent oxidoreductase [Cyanobacteria bacterium UBA8530]